jgi:hypothetical protein
VAAVGRWVRSIGPERAHLRADIVAGLPGGESTQAAYLDAGAWLVKTHDE